MNGSPIIQFASVFKLRIVSGRFLFSLHALSGSPFFGSKAAAPSPALRTRSPPRASLPACHGGDDAAAGCVEGPTFQGLGERLVEDFAPFLSEELAAQWLW